MQIRDPIIEPKQLLLDPNNYRFQDLNGYKQVSRTRYAEAGVQERAMQLLRDTPSFNLSALRESIIIAVSGPCKPKLASSPYSTRPI